MLAASSASLEQYPGLPTAEARAASEVYAGNPSNMPRWLIGVALGLVVAVTIANALQSAAWALVLGALILIGGLVLLAALVFLAAFLFGLHVVGSWYEHRQSSEPAGDCETDGA